MCPGLIHLAAWCLFGRVRLDDAWGAAYLLSNADAAAHCAQPVSSKAFSEVAAEYLAQHRLRSDDTRTMQSQVRVLTAAFGAVPVQDVTSRAIERWMATRLDQGASRATLNRNRAALSVIFEWAIREGEHPGPNPIRAIRPFREGVGRTRYLTPEEAARLLMAASPHLKTVLMLALHTGGRLGELLRLTWADVDLTAGVVTFRKETTKARRTRHVPMSDDLRAFLACRQGRPDEPVCSYAGHPLKFVTSSFHSACRKAGLGPDVVFHSTRHAAASFFVQRGGSIYDLQNILGHSAIRLTERYAHLSPEHLRSCAKFLGPPRRRLEDEGEA